MTDSVVHSAMSALAEANAACANQRALAERMSEALRKAERQHDARVLEYIELAKSLPNSIQRMAIRRAADFCAAELPLVSATIVRWLETIDPS